MAELPAPIRAALGLAASVVDAARDGRSLPDGFADKALELPVVAVTAALQLSIRLQQQYAAMTVRGDEVLTQLRGGAPDEPPEWAQFDDESGAAPSATPATPATPAPAPGKKAPSKKAAGKKVTTKKTPAKKAAAVEVTQRVVAQPAVAQPAVAKKAPATKRAAPAIPVPRTGKPSAFDLVGGDD